jgi:hypothetical protein
VVARAQRADLAQSPVDGVVGHRVRIARQASPLLAVGDVLGTGVAPRLHPLDALGEDAPQVAAAHVDVSPLPEPRGHRPVEPLGQFLLAAPDVVGVEICFQKSNSAIDVEADRSGRDDAVFEVGGGDAADGEAVAEVAVGEHQRVLADARQGRGVSHLLEGLSFLLHLLQEGVARVHPRRNAHVALLRDLVDVLVDLAKVHVEEFPVENQKPRARFRRRGKTVRNSPFRHRCGSWSSRGVGRTCFPRRPRNCARSIVQRITTDSLVGPVVTVYR